MKKKMFIMNAVLLSLVMSVVTVVAEYRKIGPDTYEKWEKTETIDISELQQEKANLQAWLTNRNQDISDCATYCTDQCTGMRDEDEGAAQDRIIEIDSLINQLKGVS